MQRINHLTRFASLALRVFSGTDLVYHSGTPCYDTSKPVELESEITRVLWRSPTSGHDRNPAIIPNGIFLAHWEGQARLADACPRSRDAHNPGHRYVLVDPAPWRNHQVLSLH